MTFGLLLFMRLDNTRYLLVEVENGVVGELASRAGILGQF